MSASPERVAAAVTALVDGTYEVVEVDGGKASGWLPGLIGMLEREARSARASGSSGAGKPGSRSPAFTPALDVLLGLRATVDEAVARLDAPARGTLAATLRGLVGITPSLDERAAEWLADSLTLHVASARVVLAIDLPPVTLRAMRCPFCGERSILASRRAHHAWCASYSCRDPEGRRHEWVGEAALRRLGTMTG